MLRAYSIIVVVLVIFAAAEKPAAVASGPALAADAVDAGWRALQAGGHVAVMRHATAPGVGDPRGFRLEDCSTQRNLSAEGRDEARRIGQAFLARGVGVDAIYSSLWCRCLETARLLGLGPVQPLPLLNSVFNEGQADADDRSRALRAWIADQTPQGTLVLVSHQVNIIALTGESPASGEIVVAKPFRDGALRVVGRIPPR